MAKRRKISKRSSDPELDPCRHDTNQTKDENETSSDENLESNGRGNRPTVKKVNFRLPALGGSGNETRPDETVEEVRKYLHETSAKHTAERVRKMARSPMPAFTVLEQATGGCLDTMAAIISGFRHLGGSEDINKASGRYKADIFEDLSGAKCFGEAQEWRNWSKEIDQLIHYYKSGMPCIDYARLGNKKGDQGLTGQLFIDQIALIAKVKPLITRLEMVPSALEVHGGREVQAVIDKLSEAGYEVHSAVIDCWKYGDPTARKRLFIVGIREDIARQLNWSWPSPKFDNNVYPTARDIAVDDDMVPEPYWYRDESLLTTFDADKATPEPGQIQTIGKAIHGKGAGHSSSPNNIRGWDGLMPTQMRSNGGSRRPKLGWSIGEPIGLTRTTVPIETCRTASLDPDSYIELANKHYNRSQLGMTRDQWLRELVNNGVPLNTGIAIDSHIHNLLIEANVLPTDALSGDQWKVDHPQMDDAELGEAEDNLDDLISYPGDARPTERSEIGKDTIKDKIDRARRVKSTFKHDFHYACADSGATSTLVDHDTYKDYITDPIRKTVEFETASPDGIKTILKGTMHVSIINLNAKGDESKWTEHALTVYTVKDFGEESTLWSITSEFEDKGFDIDLNHGYYHGDRHPGLYRPDPSTQREKLGRSHGPKTFIPCYLNFDGNAGFTIPFVTREPMSTDEEHASRLHAILKRVKPRHAHKTFSSAKPPLLYSQQEAAILERELFHHIAKTATNGKEGKLTSTVRKQVVVRTEGERNIRPAFSFGNLTKWKGRWHVFHDHFAHLGEPHANCKICDMFKGAPRRISKHKVGKPHENRPGYSWHMDMINLRHTSLEGCRYLIVVTCEACDFKQLLPLSRKSDATREMRRWIEKLRVHPAFHECPYKPVSKILTDNAGEWSEECKDFSQVIRDKLGVEVTWGDPQDHARDAARAEGANKIVEAGIQSTLYQNNLPPSWWQRAADDVMFLVNRFPAYSHDPNAPSDGDSP